MKRLLIMAALLCNATLVIAAEDIVRWNGGITIEERAEAPVEGAKLVFCIAAGNYLSRVHVVIKDVSGNLVLDAMTMGPWLILDLPSGRYSVIATRELNGDTQSLHIDVDGGPQEFGFVFRNE